MNVASGSGSCRIRRYMRVALVMAIVLPPAVTAWAILRPRKVLLVSVLFLECILLVNAGWHIFAAWVRGDDATGVLTAVLMVLRPTASGRPRRSVRCEPACAGGLLEWDRRKYARSLSTNGIKG